MATKTVAIPEIKDGIKTSEFWVTLVPQIVTVLVVLGVVPASDVDNLVKILTAIVAGVVSLVSLIAYIRSRTTIKEQAIRILNTQV